MISRALRLAPLFSGPLFAVGLALLASCTDDGYESSGDPDDGPSPDTFITKGPPVLDSSAMPRFELASDIAGATFECRLDGVDRRACTTPFVLNVREGEHTLEVYAVAGKRKDVTPARFTWKADLTAPVATLTLKPAMVDNTVRPRFEFSGESMVVFTCAVDGGEAIECVSPFTAPELEEGSHSFTLVATDAAGNVASPVRHQWWIDVTPPDTVIDSSPADFSASESATFTFSAQNASSEPSFRCALGFGAYAPCTSPFTVSALPQGVQVFSVYVVELNGSADPSPAHRTWTVDTVAPQLTIDFGPQGPTNVANPYFSFSVPFEGGLVRECRLVSASQLPDFAPCSSSYSAPVLADGDWTFEVRVRDVAGNQTLRTRSFTVDTVGPALELTSGPPQLGNSTSATFVFSAPGAAIIRCRLDSGVAVTCTSPRSLTSLSSGAHIYTITASDSLGNSTVVTYPFTVDVDAPYLSVSGPPAQTSNPSPVITFQTEADATVTCRLNSGSYAPCSSPVTLGPLTVGNYIFTVRAADSLGNVASRSVSFYVDPRPLSITITGGPLGEIRERSPQFTWTTTGAFSVACRYDVGPFEYCPSVMDVQLADGPHTFEIRAASDVGNPVYATRSFTVDTVVPGAAITGGPSGVITNPAVTFEFTTSGAPVITECRLFRDGAATGAYAPCASPHAVTLAPPSAPYPYVFEVRVQDAAGNQWSVYRSFTLTTP